VIETLLVLAALLAGNPEPPPPRTPVVVELFTSEGCSSCPPADALLRALEEQAPAAGIEVIPLGFHVDYWNELGWRDRFSSHDFTQRQVKYVELMRLDGPYTPQAVVDGTLDLVGNQAGDVRQAILQRAKSAKASVELKSAPPGDVLSVNIDRAAGDADVMLAITESNLSTKVPAGENRGRELHHTGVVRSLTRIGSIKSGTFHADAHIARKSEWKAENLRAVVFVQRRGGEIVGAATTPLAH
jgi:hypothetical protein